MLQNNTFCNFSVCSSTTLKHLVLLENQIFILEPLEAVSSSVWLVPYILAIAEITFFNPLTPLKASTDILCSVEAGLATHALLETNSSNLPSQKKKQWMPFEYFALDVHHRRQLIELHCYYIQFLDFLQKLPDKDSNQCQSKW